MAVTVVETDEGLNTAADTEAAAKAILSLPMYPELTMDDLIYICQTIKDFFRTRRQRSKQRISAGQSTS